MKSYFLQAVLLGAVVSVTASADATAGKALYATKCLACHGATGEAKESMAKMLKVTIPALGSKEVQAKSDADLKKVVTAGQGKMKPVTGLADGQVADVLAFVRTLKK